MQAFLHSDFFFVGLILVSFASLFGLIKAFERL